ncbi:MAG: CopG family antitoxin [Acidobacteriota bacterium]|jgi:predicted DNA binding CopG/RHH family protein
MAKHKTQSKLDAYEQSIEDSLGEYAPAGAAEKERILRTAAKTRTISLRINETVLESIKRKAAAEGIPYQTLISSVLYKFCSDRLIDAIAIRKAIDASK